MSSDGNALKLRGNSKLPNKRCTTKLFSGKVDPTLIKFANTLADKAATITTKYFRLPLDIIDKMDDSPVTIADQETETTIRDAIQETYPNHSIYGEEFGLKMGSGIDKDYMWVLDPIDGTKSFITGKPLFGTLIALLYKNVPIIGIIDQPILKDRWLGVSNEPTKWNGQEVRVREHTKISDAYMYSTTPEMFEDDYERPYLAITKKVKQHLYGCDCYAYGLLSSGFCDIVFETDMKVFDYMAMVPIVEGAGGCITDWEGNLLTWDGVETGGKENWANEILASATPELHEAVLEAIQWKNKLN